MTQSEWKKIKHFSPNENWGDPLLMQFSLVHLLDLARQYLAKPIIVVSGAVGATLRIQNTITEEQ